MTCLHEPALSRLGAFLQAETVASAMSRSPACIEETATMQEAAARMLKARGREGERGV